MDMARRVVPSYFYQTVAIRSLNCKECQCKVLQRAYPVGPFHGRKRVEYVKRVMLRNPRRLAAQGKTK